MDSLDDYMKYVEIPHESIQKYVKDEYSNNLVIMCSYVKNSPNFNRFLDNSMEINARAWASITSYAVTSKDAPQVKEQKFRMVQKTLQNIRNDFFTGVSQGLAS